MTQHVYGDGTNSTSGANVDVHFFDRSGVEAANRVNVYQQFADKKQMPKKWGKTFKISKFLHMYDRNQNTDADFDSKGFLTGRATDDVSAVLLAAGLAEGAGAVNERVLERVTFTTNTARYGEMISYTDEVELFSDQQMQVRYREELGELANSRHEDLIQMSMLGTGTVMYAGAATSMSTVGNGVAANGSTDDQYKVSYDLIRLAGRKLLRNRAKKSTSIVVGSNKIDTKSVAAAYYAIIGADVKADLENLTRGSTYEKEFVFTPAHKYGDASKLAEGEIGQMHETRFIEAESAMVYRGKGAVPPQNYLGSLQITGATDLTSADAADRGNFDVFPILYPTAGSFATVGLKGKDKITFRSQSPDAVELNNPYGTKGFFSYNFFYAGIILREETLLKVLVAASE